MGQRQRGAQVARVCIQVAATAADGRVPRARVEEKEKKEAPLRRAGFELGSSGARVSALPLG